MTLPGLAAIVPGTSPLLMDAANVPGFDVLWEVTVLVLVAAAAIKLLTFLR